MGVIAQRTFNTAYIWLDTAFLALFCVPNIPYTVRKSAFFCQNWQKICLKLPFFSLFLHV